MLWQSQSAHKQTDTSSKPALSCSVISTAGGTGGRHPEGGIFPPARRGEGTAPVLHPALPEMLGSTATCHPCHSFFLHCNCHHINPKILPAPHPSFHPRAPDKCTGRGRHALPSMRSRQRKDRLPLLSVTQNSTLRSQISRHHWTPHVQGSSVHLPACGSLAAPPTPRPYCPWEQPHKLHATSLVCFLYACTPWTGKLWEGRNLVRDSISSPKKGPSPKWTLGKCVQSLQRASCPWLWTPAWIPGWGTKPRQQEEHLVRTWLSQGEEK